MFSLQTHSREACNYSKHFGVSRILWQSFVCAFAQLCGNSCSIKTKQHSHSTCHVDLYSFFPFHFTSISLGGSQYFLQRHKIHGIVKEKRNFQLDIVVLIDRKVNRLTSFIVANEISQIY